MGPLLPGLGSTIEGRGVERMSELEMGVGRSAVKEGLSSRCAVALGFMSSLQFLFCMSKHGGRLNRLNQVWEQKGGKGGQPPRDQNDIQYGEGGRKTQDTASS